MLQDKGDVKYPITDEEWEKLTKSFTYHRPRDSQPERYILVRTFGREFAVTVMENCPRSEELTSALIKIEEAVMWANAAIARNEYETD